MKENKIKNSYSPQMGKAKQELYKRAHERINSSIKKGSHIEAIALTESIMSDRLEAALSLLTGRPVSASSLGLLFNKLNKLHPASEKLRNEIWNWNESRGFVIHQMVKLTNDHTSTWQERVAFSRRTAKEGVVLLNEIRKYVDSCKAISGKSFNKGMKPLK